MKKLLYNFLIFLSLLIPSTKAVSQIHEWKHIEDGEKGKIYFDKGWLVTRANSFDASNRYKTKLTIDFKNNEIVNGYYVVDMYKPFEEFNSIKYGILINCKKKEALHVWSTYFSTKMGNPFDPDTKKIAKTKQLELTILKDRWVKQGEISSLDKIIKGTCNAYLNKTKAGSVNETENLSGTDKFQTIYALLIIILPPLLLLMSNRGREYSNTPDGVKHTGFWIRALASTVDLIIFTILGFITMVTFLFATSGNMNTEIFESYQEGSFGVYAEILYTASYLLYAGIMQSSKLQATFGMMLFRFKLCDHEFKKVGFFRVVLRELTTYLSAILLCIGFLMIAFTKRKQGLHDKISKTFCVKYPKDFKNENIETTKQIDKNDENEEEDDGSGSKFKSFFISILAIPIFFIGGIAAEYTSDKFFTQYESIIKPYFENFGVYDWFFHISKNIFVGLVAGSFYVAGIKLLYKKALRGASSVPIIFFFIGMLFMTLTFFFYEFINQFVTLPDFIISEIDSSDATIEQLVGDIIYFTTAFMSFFIIFKKKKEK